MRFNACWVALQFLSRLPTPQTLDYSPQSLGKSVFCFPFVGLIIGGVLYTLSLLQPLWGNWLTSVIVVIAWLLLTGGLHIDGLADTVDAWIGGYGDKEKTLRIMKDPAIGPMGTLAILSIVLLKITTVHLLLESEQNWLLILTPMIARFQLVLLLLNTQYAKPQGMGVSMQQYANHTANWGLHWIMLIFLLIFATFNLIITVLISLLFLAYYRHQLLKRLQGTTGDTAGAWVELSEWLILFIFITLSSAEQLSLNTLFIN